jgi:hypothetical protein
VKQRAFVGSVGGDLLRAADLEGVGHVPNRVPPSNVVVAKLPNADVDSVDKAEVVVLRIVDAVADVQARSLLLVSGFRRELTEQTLVLPCESAWCIQPVRYTGFGHGYIG